MGDEDDGLVIHAVLDQVFEDVVGSVVVHSRQRVIQQHQVTIEVGTAGKVQSLALTTCGT